MSLEPFLKIGAFVETAEITAAYFNVFQRRLLSQTFHTNAIL